jgi:mono/diheme cytochrome c family protein
VKPLHAVHTLSLPLLGACAVALAAFTFAAEAADGARKVAATRAATQVERGKYIVSTAGCHDCHTPFKPTADGGAEPDMTRALSGHPQDLLMPPAPALPEGPWLVVSSGTNTAHAGPWGVSFTANLTPDPDTGIGTWTARNFRDTIRTGRHFGRGREILPPMPWPVYRNLTDEDLDAVFAYLQSIPPIRNRVPEPLPPPVAAADAAAR